MAKAGGPYTEFFLNKRNMIILKLKEEGFESKDIAFMMNRSEQLISHIIKTSKKRI